MLMDNINLESNPPSGDDAANFNLDKVRQAFEARLPLSELTGEEQEAYFDLIEALQDESTPAEEAFFAERRRRGVGVGMDDEGNIVFQAPEQTPGQKELPEDGKSSTT